MLANEYCEAYQLMNVPVVLRKEDFIERDYLCGESVSKHGGCLLNDEPEDSLLADKLILRIVSRKRMGRF